jgi:hypothetical protein
MRRFNVNQNPPNSRVFEISTSTLLGILSPLHRRGARKLTGALFSQSAPCHPPNARAEAVATHREKILRLQIGSAGGTANGKATAFKRAASVEMRARFARTSKCSPAFGGCAVWNTRRFDPLVLPMSVRRNLGHDMETCSSGTRVRGHACEHARICAVL